MHGPKVELEDLVRVFVPAADGGIFSRRSGVVDFSTGAIAPGVFAIVRSDEPRIRKEMKFITRADGPYYLHHRPYHLCDLETPQSIAEAVLLGEVTVAPEALHSEVICVAKRTCGPARGWRASAATTGTGFSVTHHDAVRRRALSIGIGAGARFCATSARASGSRSTTRRRTPPPSSIASACCRTRCSMAPPGSSRERRAAGG